jgi:hypothetical protein
MKAMAMLNVSQVENLESIFLDELCDISFNILAHSPLADKMDGQIWRNCLSSDRELGTAQVNACEKAKRLHQRATCSS